MTQPLAFCRSCLWQAPGRPCKRPAGRYGAGAKDVRDFRALKVFKAFKGFRNFRVIRDLGPLVVLMRAGAKKTRPSVDGLVVEVIEGIWQVMACQGDGQGRMYFTVLTVPSVAVMRRR